jgi:hypothetical protein
MSDQKNFVRLIYKDIQPTVQKSLRAINGVLDLLNLVGDLPSWSAEKLKRQLKKVDVKLDDVPEEKLCDTIHPQIGVPVLESLRFLEEDSALENHFITLLAKALDKDHVHEAHPGFVYKLNQLSPDEAVILHYLKKNYEIKGEVIYELGESMVSKFISHHNFDTEGIELTFPENIYMYMEHLHSLGIIEAGTENKIFTKKEMFIPNK